MDDLAVRPGNEVAVLPLVLVGVLGRYGREQHFLDNRAALRAAVALEAVEEARVVQQRFLPRVGVPACMAHPCHACLHCEGLDYIFTNEKKCVDSMEQLGQPPCVQKRSNKINMHSVLLHRQHHILSAPDARNMQSSGVHCNQLLITSACLYAEFDASASHNWWNRQRKC